jgi:hypothetical protein
MANWVKTRPEETYSDECKGWLSSLLEEYVPQCLTWIKRAKTLGATLGSGSSSCVHPADITLVHSCLRYLGDFIDEFPLFARKQAHLENAFIFAAAWGFGGHLPRAGSDEAGEEMAAGSGGKGGGAPRPASKGGGAGSFGASTASSFSAWWRETFKAVKFPRNGSIFDYWLDPSVASFSEWARSPFLMDAMARVKEEFNTSER